MTDELSGLRPQRMLFDHQGQTLKDGRQGKSVFFFFLLAGCERAPRRKMKCIMVMVNDILFLYACSVVRTGCRGELEERRKRES